MVCRTLDPSADLYRSQLASSKPPQGWFAGDTGEIVPDSESPAIATRQPSWTPPMYNQKGSAFFQISKPSTFVSALGNANHQLTLYNMYKPQDPPPFYVASSLAPNLAASIIWCKDMNINTDMTTGSSIWESRESIVNHSLAIWWFEQGIWLRFHSIPSNGSGSLPFNHNLTKCFKKKDRFLSKSLAVSKRALPSLKKTLHFNKNLATSCLIYLPVSSPVGAPRFGSSWWIDEHHGILHRFPQTNK